MITGGGAIDITASSDVNFDILFYGLGFETRSTHLAAHLGARHNVGLKLPYINLHHYKKNVRFAETRKHLIINDPLNYSISGLLKQSRDREAVKVAFDVSSINRAIMFDYLLQFAKHLRSGDELTVLYSPAAYSAPDWKFPQLERFGPISDYFTSFNTDPSLPLSLMLGLGFEPGVSMGIISQLEPRLTYCLWGSGADVRFDRTVKKANFDFRFPGFPTRAVRYLLNDPRGSFDLMEGITYGLMRDFNVVVVPLGPKIFSVLAGLLAMKHFGKISVWRAQYSRSSWPDAVPGKLTISANIDVQALRQVCIDNKDLFQDVAN
jgi:hypothetical protein